MRVSRATPGQRADPSLIVLPRLETFASSSQKALKSSYLFNLPRAEQNCLGYMEEVDVVEG